tara:strand:- start:754 stop:1131 length:378 start_codon:yes stop_codon:yes gene_type:complete
VEKSRRIDHQAKLTQIGGGRRDTFETYLVQEIDRWRSASTERDNTLEPLRSADAFNQRPSDTAAGTKSDRHASSIKRSDVNSGSHLALTFGLPDHLLFALPITALGRRTQPKRREMNGRTGRKIL